MDRQTTALNAASKEARRPHNKTENKSTVIRVRYPEIK